MSSALSCGISGLSIRWQDPARAVLVVPTGGCWGLYGEWVPVVPPVRVKYDDWDQAVVLKADRKILKLWKDWAKSHDLKLPFKGGRVSDLENLEVPSSVRHRGGGNLRLAYISDHAWNVLRAENALREENGNFLPFQHPATASMEEDLRNFAQLSREAFKESCEGGGELYRKLYPEEDRLANVLTLAERRCGVRDVLKTAMEQLKRHGETEEALLWLRGGVDLKVLDTVADGLHWRLSPCTQVSEVSDNRVARRVLRDLIRVSEEYDRKRHEKEVVEPWDESQIHWKD